VRKNRNGTANKGPDTDKLVHRNFNHFSINSALDIRSIALIKKSISQNRKIVAVKGNGSACKCGITEVRIVDLDELQPAIQKSGEGIAKSYPDLTRLGKA
jgi:hypothetical protein